MAKKGSSFQSVCIGSLQCSDEKDSEVSSRVSGRKPVIICCDLIAESAMGLGRRSRGSDRVCI